MCVSAQGPDNVQVEAGLDQTYVLRGDGSVFSCGRNNYGQLGDGTRTSRESPVQMAAVGAGNTHVSAGRQHVVILTSTGSVYCAGHNSHGECGDGTTTLRATPVEMRGVPEPNQRVEAGGDHTMILTRDGAVFGCGRNGWGQLGDGSKCSQPTLVTLCQTAHKSPPPAAFTNRLEPVEMREVGNGNREISAGLLHALVLSGTGRVFSVGGNVYGELGDGTRQRREIPAEMPVVGAGNVAIEAGAWSSHVLSPAGEVFALGRNDNRQLGPQCTASGMGAACLTPQLMEGVGPVSEVAAGLTHTLVVRPSE